MQAGWYTDPHNPTLHRWWDGHAWTQHTQPAFAATSQPFAVAQPAPPGRQPTWVLIAAVAMVTAIVAVVITVILVRADNAADAERAAAIEAAEARADRAEAKAQLNVCKVEKKTILAALEATKAVRGAYPANISDMVGEGPTDFLQSDPSARWNSSGGPATLVGIGKCAGL